MTRVNVTLKESNAKIQELINKAVAKQLNISIPKSKSEIKSLVKKRLFDAITSQPEYQSIVDGDLRVELGLVDGGTRLLGIIDKWLSSLEVKFTQFKASAVAINGGLTIQAIQSDYSDVINTKDAILITEKGERLPWLQWMLLSGGSRIIADYHVEFKAGKGRTGEGSMSIGGDWRVPSQFSGSLGDNFVTRAIESIQHSLEQDIAQIIQGKI